MNSKLQFRVMIALLAVLFGCFLHAAAQSSSSDDCTQFRESTKEPPPCNGISVGAPKVFDNRTLTLMLESLSQTLQTQQQNYIDQKSVAAALANIQGFAQTETSTNLSLTTTPTPATDVKTTLNTGNVDANGNPLPNTLQRQTDVNRASVTPQAPALDTLPAFQGFTPTYGNSASDLLSDQVNLTYQIFNLRMILERALSDRLNPDANGDNRTRLQAVLGFNVTLDPPRTANDAVAVVEITLTSSDKDKKPLSLVALMPQEKTYNAAALNSKSNAFAGSAVVSSFQVGFSARKRGQVFYLYRDNDTISYERMTNDPNKIVFGWMFRPVLGRRSVSPGLRQLFAIAGLPNVDRLKDVTCTGNDKDGIPCKLSLSASVRTYWKKYDRGTLTSFERRDANVAKEFWYGLSLTLAEPQIFDQKKYVNKAAYTVDVRPSSEYERDLGPTVSDVIWRTTGAKSVVVSARGNNFFSQTKVALGDATYSEGTGLILKSNQAFDLITTIDALANGPGTILGRYDNGVALIAPATLPTDSLKDGVEVRNAFLTPAIAGLRKIQIVLQGKPSDTLAIQLKIANDARIAAQHFKTMLEQNLAPVLAALSPDRNQSPKAQRSPTALRSAISSLEQVSLPTPTPGADHVNNALPQIATAIHAASENLNQAVASHNFAQNAADAVTHAREQLNAALSAADDAVRAAETSLKLAESQISATHPAQVLQLPVMPESHKTAAQNTAKALETPVISVNGTPLDLPYQITNIVENNVTFVMIQANIKDSIVSETGGGIVKVSWPFYPQDKWTATYRFYNPDLAFEVTRVSSKTIIIHRNDSFSFKKGPEIDENTPACWTLIAADTEIPLTAACPAKPAPKDCQKKAKTDPCTPPPLGTISESTVAATSTTDSLPDKVVLVAPSGAIYNLTVPPVKAKDDKAVPIELKQYDSQWIEIKSSELTTSATPAAGAAAPAAKGTKDFSQLTAVEANNGPVNYVLPEPDPKAIDEKTKKPKPPVSIKVEITRALTSKPGTIDIAFIAGKRLIGTRQIHITQTEWGNKGNK
jgi:hypothetical protein